jgi:hypothetical protein
MATKKITPTNPATEATDEVKDEDKTEAERKTACAKFGRKTASVRFG